MLFIIIHKYTGNNFKTDQQYLFWEIKDILIYLFAALKGLSATPLRLFADYFAKFVALRVFVA